MKKRTWQAPAIMSVDNCEPVFGACNQGTTAAPGSGGLQCNTGRIAGKASCSFGFAAVNSCGNGGWPG